LREQMVGMKSRGMYETKGGTILNAAHRGNRMSIARPRRHCIHGRADGRNMPPSSITASVAPERRNASSRDRPPARSSAGEVRLKLYRATSPWSDAKSTYSLYGTGTRHLRGSAPSITTTARPRLQPPNALRMRTLGSTQRRSSAVVGRVRFALDE